MSERAAVTGDAGFGLIEMVVAITIIAGTFVGLARSTAGGLFALESARQRSVFVEEANAQMESLRALPFESLGVSNTDPERSSAYPDGMHEGQSAVVLDVATLQTSNPSFTAPPAAVSIVTTSTVQGIRTPYTVRRWVTWSVDAGPAGASDMRRISVELTWSESGRGTRHVVLHSLRYPGGKGPGGDNVAPVAAATATPATTVVGTPITFDGSGSADPDGSIATYAWKFGDGITGSGVSVSHGFAAPGTYSVVLTVTDNGGATASSPTTVTVTAPSNLPPVAIFTAPLVSGTAPFTVNVDGSTSYDPEGTSLTYSWRWGDNTTNGSGVSAAHIYAVAGTYTLTLTVTDGAGLQGSATLSVTAVPLDCSITGAWFVNGTNLRRNDIVVGADDKATDSSFAFTATTNAGCTSMSASIPNISGAMVGGPLVGPTRTWTLSMTYSGKFAVALNQSGTFSGSGGATFPISLDVHR